MYEEPNKTYTIEKGERKFSTFLTGVRKKKPVKTLMDTFYHASKEGKLPFLPSHTGLPTSKVIDRILNRKRQAKGVIPEKMKIPLSTVRKKVSYLTHEGPKPDFKPVKKKDYKPIRNLEKPGIEKYIFNMNNSVLKHIFQQKRDQQKGVIRDIGAGKIYTRS